MFLYICFYYSAWWTRNRNSQPRSIDNSTMCGGTGRPAKSGHPPGKTADDGVTIAKGSDTSSLATSNTPETMKI